MHNHGYFRYEWLALLLLAACAPAVQARPEPQVIPSPPEAWSLKLTQSGGFAGVMLTVEVSSDGQLTATNERASQAVKQTLPAETIKRLGQLYPQGKPGRPTGQSGCADCFLYSLEARSGGRILQIDADDTTLADSGAAELIRLLQQLRDQALKSAS